MGLFPQSFIDDLRMQADILQIVQAHVSLRRAGTSYKGLCPFHAEKTPSFNVNPERGIFHCFGCGVGGDVFKFVELHEKVAFPDAVRLLASRVGLSVPEPERGRRDPAEEAEREALLKMHELAAAYYRAQLAGPGGTRVLRYLEQRGLMTATIDVLGYGYAPPERSGLRGHLEGHGFEPGPLVRSGLVVERQGGELVDRFRNRLLVPICRETGSVVAFGGRALDEGQVPKYLNSPETAIYTKGRTLYGLHVTRAAIRRLGYAVLVEGYFDFAQAYQGGITPVVATCGTALTPMQARSLRRLATKVILSFDQDAAGQTATARSSELLVTEGFQVNVTELPAGQDPDTFIQRHGGTAYREKLRSSRPYLEHVLDRTAGEHDLGTDGGRRAFLGRMLGVAARIPDAAARDQFADRLAHKARITEDVVRAEIRKAAVQRRVEWTPPAAAREDALRTAESGLIWNLMRQPEATATVMAELEPADLEGLQTEGILQLALSLAGAVGTDLPGTLLERLSDQEVALVRRISERPEAPDPPDGCVYALKRLRFERERSDLQREIDRLQEAGAQGSDERFDALGVRQRELKRRMEAEGF
jgi:DNA primase